MTAFINYHPHPSPYAARRALYAAAVGILLIVLALVLLLPSASSGGTQVTRDIPVAPLLVVPDPVFAN